MSTKMKKCGVVRHKPVICKPASQCADETQGGEEGSGKKSVHGGKRYCFEETHVHAREAGIRSSSLAARGRREVTNRNRV